MLTEASRKSRQKPALYSQSTRKDQPSETIFRQASLLQLNTTKKTVTPPPPPVRLSEET